MSFGEGDLHEQAKQLRAELEAERKKKRYEFVVDGKCESCTERRGYYMDAETIASQQEHIAELENAYSLLQSQFDITRERWMKRGEYIAKQRERIEALESLVRDMWFKNIGRMDYCGWCVIGCDNEENCELAERMDELGLTEVGR